MNTFKRDKKISINIYNSMNDIMSIKLFQSLKNCGKMKWGNNIIIH